MTTRTDTKNSIKKISQVINLLGRIMGLVIKEQEGIDLLNKVDKEIKILDFIRYKVGEGV